MPGYGYGISDFISSSKSAATRGGASFDNTYSCAFDGVDDYLEGGDVLHNDGQTPMTLSAWVNISTPAPHTRVATIAGKKRIRNAPKYAMRGWDIGFITSGAQTNRLQFRIVGVDSGGSVIGSLIKKALTLSFTDGLWHNVVVTYDGSESATGVKFYVDAIEDTSTQTLSDTLSGNSPNDPTVDFKIGTAPRYGGDYFYNGNIDELAIWSSTALTQEQVTAIYNLGNPTDLTSLSPVSWWRMGDPNGQSSFPTITDDGSASNDVTMTNMIAADIETDVP